MQHSNGSSFKDCPHWAIHNNFSFCLPISWGYVLVTYFPFKHKDDESVGSSPHLLYIHDWLIVNNGWCKNRTVSCVTMLPLGTLLTQSGALQLEIPIPDLFFSSFILLPHIRYFPMIFSGVSLHKSGGCGLLHKG